MMVMQQKRIIKMSNTENTENAENTENKINLNDFLKEVKLEAKEFGFKVKASSSSKSISDIGGALPEFKEVSEVHVEISEMTSFVISNRKPESALKMIHQKSKSLKCKFVELGFKIEMFKIGRRNMADGTGAPFDTYSEFYVHLLASKMIEGDSMVSGNR